MTQCRCGLEINVLDTNTNGIVNRPNGLLTEIVAMKLRRLVRSSLNLSTDPTQNICIPKFENLQLQHVYFWCRPYICTLYEDPLIYGRCLLHIRAHWGWILRH